MKIALRWIVICSVAVSSHAQAQADNDKANYSSFSEAFKLLADENLTFSAEALVAWQESVIRKAVLLAETHRAKRLRVLLRSLASCITKDEMDFPSSPPARGQRQSFYGAVHVARRLLDGSAIDPDKQSYRSAEWRNRIDKEYQNVLDQAQVVPFFVKSSDPESASVDWAVTEPDGLYRTQPQLVRLFRTVQYLRHLDLTTHTINAKWNLYRNHCPAVRQAASDIESIESVLADMFGATSEVTSRSLIPWVQSWDSEMISRVVRQNDVVPKQVPNLIATVLGQPDGLFSKAVVANEQQCGPRPRGNPSSVREHLIRSLEWLVANRATSALGGYFETDEWTAQRLNGAVGAYVALRQMDALATSGPITGSIEPGSRRLFVEPDPKFFLMASKTSTVLLDVLRALEQVDQDAAADLVQLGTQLEQATELCHVVATEQAERNKDFDKHAAELRDLITQDLIDTTTGRVEEGVGIGGARLRLPRVLIKVVPVEWNGQILHTSVVGRCIEKREGDNSWSKVMPALFMRGQ